MNETEKKVKKVHVVTLTIDGIENGSKELKAVVGGRNGSPKQLEAWQSLYASRGVLESIPHTHIVCVLKDGNPRRQMTVANLLKGLEIVKPYAEAMKSLKSIKKSLADLQKTFDAIPEVEFSADNVKNDLASFIPAKQPAGK